MTTPTQDQLKKEYRDWLMCLDEDERDRMMEDGTIWHWITTVYEPKVREEERTKLLEEQANFEEEILHIPPKRRITVKSVITSVTEETLSQLPTPDKDHE